MVKKILNVANNYNFKIEVKRNLDGYEVFVKDEDFCTLKYLDFEIEIKKILPEASFNTLEPRRGFRKLFHFLRTLFWSKCPNCKQKGVRYIGDDWTGGYWISVSECYFCKKEFV